VLRPDPRLPPRDAAGPGGVVTSLPTYDANDVRVVRQHAAAAYAAGYRRGAQAASYENGLANWGMRVTATSYRAGYRDGQAGRPSREAAIRQP